MENLLPVLLIIGLSMIAMIVGLIFKNKPLRKACGDSPDGCEICGGDPVSYTHLTLPTKA